MLYEENNKNKVGSAVQNPRATRIPRRINNSNKDWAKGDLSVSGEGVFFRPQNNKSTVQGQMSGILASNSPYIKSHEADAIEKASGRGLLNTTMAATAGRKAAIDAAMPIAQQDAGYFQNLNLQGQQGNIQSRLQKEAGEIESGHIGQRGDVQEDLYNVQGDISSRLQKEAGDIESRHMSQKGDIDQRLLRTQGDIESRQIGQKGDIEARLAQMGYDHEKAIQSAEMEWNKIDLQARMDVEYDRMDQETKSRFDSTSAQITSEYQQKYMEILADPSFATTEDRKVAIDRLNRITQQRFQVAAKIADVKLNWITYLPNWSTA